MGMLLSPKQQFWTANVWQYSLNCNPFLEEILNTVPAPAEGDTSDAHRQRAQTQPDTGRKRA